jgi:hypothetical protein
VGLAAHTRPQHDSSAGAMVAQGVGDRVYDACSETTFSSAEGYWPAAPNIPKVSCRDQTSMKRNSDLRLRLRTATFLTDFNVPCEKVDSVLQKEVPYFASPI